MSPYFEKQGITLYHGDCREVLPTLGPVRHRYRWTLRPIEHAVFGAKTIPETVSPESGRFNFGTACLDRELTEHQRSQHSLEYLGAEGGLVSHVITDPPYETEVHAGGRRVLGGTRPGHAVETWRDAEGVERFADLGFDPMTEELREAASAEFARLTSRWALVFCQAEGAHKWERALLCAGMRRRRWCIWVKPDGQPQISGDRPGVGYETIVAMHGGISRTTWNGGGKLGVFTHAKNVTGSRESNPHPTTKPLPLMAELVSLFTDPGETILDPFCGSGTTLVAAYQLGRKAIGIELEEKWCEVSAKRLEREMAQGRFEMAIPEPAQQEALL